ncbi:hypothetical protein [Sinomonas soli]
MRIAVARTGTWPPELARIVELLHRFVPPEEEYLADLEVPYEADDTLWDAMSGHHIAARHFTRLLDYEAEAIRAEGLRMYSRELSDHRVDEAARRGLIPAAAGDAPKGVSLPAVDPTGILRGQRRFVWMTIGRTLEDRCSGVEPFLRNWGGEGIHFSTATKEHLAPLQQRSRPAAIHLLLCADLARKMVFRPCGGRILLGAYRGLEGVSADVRADHPMPPEAIERVEFLD